MCCSIFCILVHCYCLYYISQNQDVCSYSKFIQYICHNCWYSNTTFHIGQFLISNKYGRTLTLHPLYNCTTKLQYSLFITDIIIDKIKTPFCGKFIHKYLHYLSDPEFKTFHHCFYWYWIICKILLTLNTYFHKLLFLKVSTWKLILK